MMTGKNATIDEEHASGPNGCEAGCPACAAEDLGTVSVFKARGLENETSASGRPKGRAREGWKFEDRFNGGQRGYTRVLKTEVPAQEFDRIRAWLTRFADSPAVSTSTPTSRVFRVCLVEVDAVGRVEAECAYTYDVFHQRIYGTLYYALFSNDIGNVGRQNARTFGMGLMLDRMLKALNGAS